MQAIQYVKDDKPENWTWTGNVVQGKLGIPPVKGIVVGNPHLSLKKDGLALPTAKTPTAQADTKHDSLKTDIFGKPRKGKATIGAIQFPLPFPAPGQLTAKDVGPNAGIEKNEPK